MVLKAFRTRFLIIMHRLRAIAEKNKVTRVMRVEAPRQFYRMCAVPGSPSQKERILSKFGQIQGILQNSNF